MLFQVNTVIGLAANVWLRKTGRAILAESDPGIFTSSVTATSLSFSFHFSSVDSRASKTDSLASVPVLAYFASLEVNLELHYLSHWQLFRDYKMCSPTATVAKPCLRGIPVFIAVMLICELAHRFTPVSEFSMPVGSFSREGYNYGSLLERTNMAIPLVTEGAPSLRPMAWVDEFGDYLFRYAVSRLRDVGTAEDVVQQTFLSGFQNREQFTGSGSERGWLLGILKRKIIDTVRQRSRTSQLTDSDGNDPLDQMFDQKGSWKQNVRSTLLQPLDAVEASEFWPILQQCLNTLPQRQADVFMLREMDDLETEVVCKELAITASNLWVLLHRARVRLASCMKARWFQEKS